eukprot:1149258-Pelagomonas_calceolata.AAC.5
MQNFVACCDVVRPLTFQCQGESEKDSSERVKRGQVDGHCKADLPHRGVTNKFQADWREPLNCPLREHRLDGGLDANNEYVAKCTLCRSSFRCRAQNVRVHEQGKKHKALIAAWQQRQFNSIAK